MRRFISEHHASIFVGQRDVDDVVRIVEGTLNVGLPVHFLTSKQDVRHVTEVGVEFTLHVIAERIAPPHIRGPFLGETALVAASCTSKGKRRAVDIGVGRGEAEDIFAV